MRPYDEQKLVEHLGIRLKIVELEGFIFFASANQIIKLCKSIVGESSSLPWSTRIRYVVFTYVYSNRIVLHT